MSSTYGSNNDVYGAAFSPDNVEYGETQVYGDSSANITYGGNAVYGDTTKIYGPEIGALPEESEVSEVRC